MSKHYKRTSKMYKKTSKKKNISLCNKEKQYRRQTHRVYNS